MKGRAPTLPSDRDVFLMRAWRQADDGRQVGLRDALLALATYLDIEALARRTGEARDILVNERLSARRRVLAALGE